MTRSFLPLIASIAAVLGIAAASTSLAQTTPTKAVAFREDPVHGGSTAFGGVASPLVRRWSVDVGALPSYPIVADGKVIITYPHTESYGTSLLALDAETGAVAWGPVDLEGTFFWGGLAYEDGRVFTLGFDGYLKSFSASSGAQLWAVHLGSEYYVITLPTAYHGVVYAVGSYEVWAVNALNGAILWSAPFGALNTSPAVTDEAVYVSSGCEVRAFRPSDGAALWTTSFACSDGFGSVPVVHLGRLSVEWLTASGVATGAVFDATTGRQLGSHPGGSAPSFLGTLRFFTRMGEPPGLRELVAFDDAKGELRWTFRGDGDLTTPSLVVDGVVYVGSQSGQLYALNPTTGSVLWSDNLGAPADGVDLCCARTWSGPAAGEGLLVVPAGTTLIAYESAAGASTYDRWAQDETSGDVLEFNSSTGAYRLSECATGSVTAGVGETTRNGSCKTLFKAKDVARISATLNTCKNSGRVTVKFARPYRSLRIVDSNLADEIRRCP